MLYCAIFLTLGYLAYLVYEKRSNDKYLASFQQVIHVNGIRGKTSTCRLIDGVLREGGYRVFTKTTGSTPVYIDTGGVEHLIRRNGAANIKEQLKMIKQAYREHAEVLILECMAVSPELQRVTQREIVKGSLNVITNVRYDHIFDMGETLDEIAESLSNTIPEGGVLFTADEQYYPYFSEICAKRHTKAVLCTPDVQITDENQAVAYGVGSYLGMDREHFFKGIERYKTDFGAQKRYKWGRSTQLFNFFSVNDPQSTRKLLAQDVEDTAGAIFVYNHRLDRPDRLLLFIRYFFKDVDYQKILIIGENKGFAQRMLRKNGCDRVEILSDWREILQMKDAVLVGIGNIKGDAYELITYLEEDNSHE